MFSEFLNAHSSAQSLDKNEFKRLFVANQKKADYLLFNREVVCEIKRVEQIHIANKIETLWRKNLPNEKFGTAVSSFFSNET
jgi:hypothetical protein